MTMAYPRSDIESDPVVLLRKLAKFHARGKTTYEKRGKEVVVRFENDNEARRFNEVLHEVDGWRRTR